MKKLTNGKSSMTHIWISLAAGLLILGGVFAFKDRLSTPKPEDHDGDTAETGHGDADAGDGEAGDGEAALPREYPALAVLPEIPFPADNPYSEEKAELGKLLYFDTRMSGDGSLSCNSCHPASDGSWAVSSPISFGYPGSSHWRNASTIINTAYFTKYNWDGGKTSVEKQAKGAWGGVVAGNLDSGMAEEQLAQVPEYVAMFKAVFGTDYPLYENALHAVATFERTIVSQNVPFDAFLEGDSAAISADALAGYELFTGQANCIACHNGALVSDGTFHNTAVPTYEGFSTNPLEQITFRFEHWAKGVTEEDYDTATMDMGLYYVTKLHSDIGKFKTPSLRDSCYTSPYMHNGAFSTLSEVVAFYNAGGGDHENKDVQLQPLGLSAEEQTQLVAFLESLCGDKITFDAPDLPAYAPWDMDSAALIGEN